MQKEKKKDRIFSISGLKEEFGKIKWPKWTSRKKDEDTVLSESSKVIGFTGFTVIYFIIGGLVLSGLLTVIGVF